MTEQEELMLVRAMGDALSVVTKGIPLGVALLVMTERNRIHAISNVDQARMTAIVQMYVTGLPAEVRRESTWLLLRCRQVDGVSVESIVGAYSTKEVAEEALEQIVEQNGVSYSIEEQEIKIKGQS